MKVVVATALGHDGIDLRRPGDRFAMPDDAKASWFKDEAVPAEESKAADSKPGRKSKES